MYRFSQASNIHPPSYAIGSPDQNVPVLNKWATGRLQKTTCEAFNSECQNGINSSSSYLNGLVCNIRLGSYPFSLDREALSKYPCSCLLLFFFFFSELSGPEAAQSVALRASRRPDENAPFLMFASPLTRFYFSPRPLVTKS